MFLTTKPIWAVCTGSFQCTVFIAFISPHHGVSISFGGRGFLFYSILFYSILFYSILFYSILHYSILFFSVLFYSSLGGGLCNVSVCFLWVCADCLGGCPYSLHSLYIFSSLILCSLLFSSILYFSILLYCSLGGSLCTVSVCFYGCVPIACVVGSIACLHYIPSLLFCSLLFSSVLYYSILSYDILVWVVACVMCRYVNYGCVSIAWVVASIAYIH